MGRLRVFPNDQARKRAWQMRKATDARRQEGFFQLLMEARELKREVVLNPWAFFPPGTSRGEFWRELFEEVLVQVRGAGKADDQVVGCASTSSRSERPDRELVGAR
jgi:hypothetical protein